MAEEILAVGVGGVQFAGWRSASVYASVSEAARSFRLEVAAEVGAEMTAQAFKAGTAVKIQSNGDLMIDGYVDQYQPEIDEKEAKIAVAGRSKSEDLVDSSAEHKTGHFKDKTPAEIAKELSRKLGIKVESEGQLLTVTHQLTPGRTIFREIEKLCRDQGFAVSGTVDGIRIWVPGKSQKRHAGAIVQGVNLKRGSANHDQSGRHSRYVVRGQKAAGHGPDALEIEQIAKDAGVDRDRVLIVVEKADTDQKRAKSRAENHRDRAAGASLSASLALQGFRDEAGKLWEPGYLIWVESPFLDLAQDMLIESITFTQDEGGSISVLQVVDPRAYGAKKKAKGNKSGKSWNQSSTPAETGTGLLDE